MNGDNRLPPCALRSPIAPKCDRQHNVIVIAAEDGDLLLGGASVVLNRDQAVCLRDWLARAIWELDH